MSQKPSLAYGCPDLIAAPVVVGVLSRRGRVGAGVAVVRPRGGAGVLVQLVRVEVEPVQAGVQRGELVLARAADRDHAECLVPGGLRGGVHRVEAAPPHLLVEVAPGLVDADEGGRDPHGELPAGAEREGGVAADVGPAAAGEGAGAGHRPVEGRVDEHPRRAPESGDVRVAGDGAVCPVHGQPAAVVDVVEDQAVGAGGEGEPHHRGVVGGRDLGTDAVVERHAVVVGLRGLVVVAEGQAAGGAVGGRRGAGRRRHDLERLVVLHPDAGLVADPERLDHRFVGRVVVLLVGVDRAGGARVGLGRPEVEAVRDRGGREVVAARVVAGGVRAARGDHAGGGVRAVVRRRRGPHRDVVEPAAEVGGAARVVVVDQDAGDGLARGDGAEVGVDRVPLPGVQDLRRALGAGRQALAVLVGRAEPAEPAAVAEHQVHRDVSARIGKIVAGALGEDRVRQAGVVPDRDRHPVDLVLDASVVGELPAGVLQRVGAGEADVLLEGGAGGRAVADGRGHPGGAAVSRGERQLGQLALPVTVVGGHREPVAAVRPRVPDREEPGLAALREVLAALAVDHLPALPVVRPLQLPGLRVLGGGVGRRGHRVARHPGRVAEGDGQRGGRGAGLPGGGRVTVGGLGGAVVGRHFRTRGDRGDRRHHRSRQRAAVVRGDPGCQWSAVGAGLRCALPVRCGVGCLERGGEGGAVGGAGWGAAC